MAYTFAREMEEHSKEGKPWVAIHEEYGDIEGHILGNASGLQELKDRIDEALQTGVGLSRHLGLFRRICG